MPVTKESKKRTHSVRVLKSSWSILKEYVHVGTSDDVSQFSPDPLARSIPKILLAFEILEKNVVLP